MNVRPEFLHPKVLHECAPARLKVAAWGLGDSNILVGWLQITMWEQVHTSAIDDIEGSRVPGKPSSHDFLGPPLFLQALSGYQVLNLPVYKYALPWDSISPIQNS